MLRSMLMQLVTVKTTINRGHFRHVFTDSPSNLSFVVTLCLLAQFSTGVLGATQGSNIGDRLSVIGLAWRSQGRGHSGLTAYTDVYSLLKF